MKKYTLYIGLNDQNSKRQEIPTREAVAIVTEILYRYTDGATLYRARGIYTHDDGSKVSEETIRAEILDFAGDGAAAIMTAAQEIKRALNQESIALQTEEVVSELI